MAIALLIEGRDFRSIDKSLSMSLVKKGRIKLARTAMGEEGFEEIVNRAVDAIPLQIQ